MDNNTLHDKPMFSNRDLVNLTIPLIFDSLLSIAAGLIDSAMVSSAGVAAVSGVSLVASLSLVFTVTFNAIAAGGVVVTSQYLGNGDTEKARMRMFCSMGGPEMSEPSTTTAAI